MARRKRKLTSEINVVPYIDIMLVLLVVFMVTAPLFSQGYQVELPSSSAQPLDIRQQTQVVISVTDQAEYHYSQGSINREVNLGELQAMMTNLLQEDAEPDVFIKGDRLVAYEAVINLMASLQEIGVDNVGLLTQPASP